MQNSKRIWWLGFVALLALTACGGGNSMSAATPNGNSIGSTPPSNNTPPPQTYAIGGTVSGLNGTGLTLSNGSDSLRLDANGSFTFATKVASGLAYSLTIASQPSASPSQFCTIANGGNSGTVTDSDVTGIQVICADVGKFLYLANGTANSVAVYAINGVSGALSSMALGPYSTGPAPLAVAIDDAVSALYVANSGDGTISAYLIDRDTGALSAVTGSPFAVGGAPFALTISPSGSLLYVEARSGTGPDGNGVSVVGFSVDQTTGALTSVSGNPVATFPQAIGSATFDRSGNYLYIPGTSIYVYQVDAASGGLTSLGSDYTPFTYPASAATSPDGRFLYATGDDTGLLAYSIDANTGALTPLTGSPFSTPLEIDGVAVRLSGGFAYVSPCNCRLGDDPGSIYGFALNGQTGVPTALVGSPAAAGTLPTALVFDPSGKFAYEANTFSLDVSGYSVDANTGSLTAAPGSPFAIVGRVTGPDPAWPALIAISN